MQAEGLALVAERDVIYAMPASGVYRFRPLAVDGPMAVVLAALSLPSDRASLVSVLSATYADEFDRDFAVATDRIVGRLLESGLIVETDDDGAVAES